MGRRFKTRGICKDRNYTIKIAARIIGVSEAQFRKWAKEGLRLIKDQRPFLVRGGDLIDFLQRREAARKVPMGERQFYCMRCKTPRDALEGSVSFKAATALTGRLSGACDTCGGNLGQFCSTRDAAAFIPDATAPSK